MTPGALGFGPVQFPAVEAMHDPNMIVDNVFPLQCQNFTRAHSGEQCELHDQLFAQIDGGNDRLYFLGRKHSTRGPGYRPGRE